MNQIQSIWSIVSVYKRLQLHQYNNLNQKVNMNHLSQILQQQKLTPFAFSQQFLSVTLKEKGQRVIPFVKQAFTAVNAMIMSLIGKKQAVIVSGAIGISTLALFQLKKYRKRSTRQKQNNREKKESHASSGSENQETTDLQDMKWTKEAENDYSLQQILQMSKEESTCIEADTDKLFFQVYQAYLDTDQ